MSEQLTLSAEARDRAGKGASRALRREGRVPAVIYGMNEEPLSIHVEEKLLNKQLGRRRHVGGRNVAEELREGGGELGLRRGAPVLHVRRDVALERRVRALGLAPGEFRGRRPNGG